MKGCFIRRYGLYILLLLFSISCRNSEQEQLKSVIKEWKEKEILFPQSPIFTIEGRDTVIYYDKEAKFNILIYADSTGCTSCKLQLSKWKMFISEIDSLSDASVDFLFYVTPKDAKKLSYLIKREHFNFPICIDPKDSINLLNSFPKDDRFHTMLLNEKNKVLVIGNPIHNLEIKNLFIKTITNNNSLGSRSNITRSTINHKSHDFGCIEKGKVYTKSFLVRNLGYNKLYFSDFSVSCECVKVTMPQDSIPQNGIAKITISYSTTEDVDFQETIHLRSNSYPELPPIKISGRTK